MPLRELPVRRSVELRVRDWPEQDLEEDVRRSPVLGHQADDGGHVAADAVTDRGEAPAVDADLVAVCRHPLRGGIGLVDGDRLWHIGGADVDYEHLWRGRAGRVGGGEATVGL